jgi:hypothetical protein
LNQRKKAYKRRRPTSSLEKRILERGDERRKVRSREQRKKGERGDRLVLQWKGTKERKRLAVMEARRMVLKML